LCSTVRFSVTVDLRVARFVVVVLPSVFVLFVSLNVVRVDELEVGRVPGPSVRAAALGTGSTGSALADGTAAGSGGKLESRAAVALESVNADAGFSPLRVPQKSAPPSTAASKAPATSVRR